jgi:alkylation response protein AidB-like acyl-CoA dehydrogenase
VPALTLTQEHEALRDSTRAFLDAEYPVAALRALRDGHDPVGFSKSSWAKCVDMGWTGLLLPRDARGSGFGYVGAGLISEQIGRTLAATPFLATCVLGVTALVAGGTETQRRRWLPLIRCGSAFLALAVDETGKHAPASIALRATPSADGFTLSGNKIFVLDGQVADAFVVSARTAGPAAQTSDVSLFLVPRDVFGLTIEPTTMLDSRNAARLCLQSVPVSRADALGTIGDADAVLTRVLDGGRACLAAELLGLGDEIFRRTLEYLKHRTQFGRPIGSFQALQHRMAMLYCELELTRSTVLAALQALDEEDADSSALVALAKAKAADVAGVVAAEGLQMHGGIGMTDEFDLGLFIKRARVAAETFGDGAYHGAVLARKWGF